MERLAAGYLFITVSIWLFWRAINYLRLVRVIEDTPTTSIASTPQGMVEVKGKTLPLVNQVLMVPRKNIPCVWYRYEKTYTQDDDVEAETIVKESHERFLIEDHTGHCAIDPYYADIHAKRTLSEYEDGYQHEVSWIGVDDYIYVLGWMNTLHPSPKTDDVITVREGREHHYGQLTDKLDRISKPPHDWLPFIISTRFEHAIVKHFRYLFINWFIGGALVLVFAGWIFV